MICLLCGQNFISQVALINIFSWSPVPNNKLCPSCLAKFNRLQGNYCQICHKTLPNGIICDDCMLWQKIYGENLLVNHAVYHYNDAFHDLMVAFKRYGDYCLREVLQELCQQDLSQIKADYYVPVPTSPEHDAVRRYDTISAIYADLVPLSMWLKKSPHTTAQGEKNKHERLASPQSFYLSTKAGQIRADLSGKKILLLDDIYTTGRTLYHARDALQVQFPQAIISSFTICR